MINEQIQEFSDLLNYAILANVRVRLLGDLTSAVRQYQILTWTRHILPAAYTPIYIAQVQNKIKTLSATLSGAQFSLIQATLSLNGTNFVSSDIKPYTFELFLQDETVLQNELFLDGYFQYMTAVDRVRAASLDSLVSPQSSTDLGMQSLLFAIRNGLGPLREGAEAMLENFDVYHTERKNHYSKTFKIILIITEIAIAVAALISIPFGFAAFQTKDKIIALFGYIPGSEIEIMIEKGERFREEYLETSGIENIDEEFSFVENSGLNRINHASPPLSPEESQVRSNIEESEEPDMVNIDENLRIPSQMSPVLVPTTTYRQTTMGVASPRSARDAFFDKFSKSFLD